MRFYRHVNEQLLRDLVAAYRGHAPSAVSVAIVKIEAELKSIDDESAKEAARDAARKTPPLTTQKVTGVLRKAGLDISATHNSRIGPGTGMRVEYGDWDLRTWVRVFMSYSWDWEHYHKSPKADHTEKSHKKAQAALEAAGLHVEHVSGMGPQGALKVTA
jgi:hypothetical protein